ncbi:MAG TPA: protein kinase [Kofleriaceae bacterium]
MTSRDDELARTATAAVGATPATAPASTEPVIGGMLGRYRLERELGAGGMGVVYAAFDPDLERRVALKVLRAATGDDARKRLLREARAMARLAHVNVVTVHEVGSANGRDYVAMELVEGETLADWLRSERRHGPAIISAFVAAGRGLAAAHAAGIVHRDFKPHNVLRSRDGRILVTDFGLAREAEVALDPLATTHAPLPTATTVAVGTTPTALAGLTVTGSVLGTPAYMAPEQWTGGTVTPATDQFAYCVGVWEALAGDRPYKGPSFEDLRSQVAKGPAALDASKIPRRLRRILRRGLDPAPSRRWPSMDALLSRLVLAERSLGVALGIVGAAAAGALALAIAMRLTSHPEVPPCALPIMDPQVVWSPEHAQEMHGKGVDQIFAGDFAAWLGARVTACTAEPRQLKEAQLACLDGVLARFDAVRQSASLPPPATSDDIAAELVQSDVCIRPEPPRLATSYSHAAIVGLALQRTHKGDTYDDAAETAALAEAGDDPCARAQIDLARLQWGKAGSREAADRVADTAAACGDDRLRVEAMEWTLLGRAASPFVDAKFPDAVRALDRAVAKVDQPDLRASVATVKARIAMMRGQTVEAANALDEAIKGYGTRRPRRKLESMLGRIGLLLDRGSPEALADARQRLREAKALDEAVKEPRAHDALMRELAMLDWLDGKVQVAEDELAKLPPDPDVMETLHKMPSHAISGVVVDAAGKPVGGALVAAGVVVIGDSATVGAQFSAGETAQRTTTASDGTYAFPEIPVRAVVVAQKGALRSQPAVAGTGVQLRLEPTTKVSGKVDLHAPNFTDHGGVVIAFTAGKHGQSMYQVAAPIAADGTFTIDAMPRGPAKIGVATGGPAAQLFESRDLLVGDTPITGIALSVSAGHPLRVLVRSSTMLPLTGAIVIVVPGKFSLTSMADVAKQLVTMGGLQSAPATAVFPEQPPTVASVMKSGDVLALFKNAPQSGTACAFGVQGDFADPSFVEKLNRHMDEVHGVCAPITADEPVLVIEAPPMKRLD